MAIVILVGLAFIVGAAVVMGGYLGVTKGPGMILLVTADVALMVRAVCEERILARDPEYRAYQQIVRWRIVPGVF